MKNHSLMRLFFVASTLTAIAMIATAGTPPSISTVYRPFTGIPHAYTGDFTVIEGDSTVFSVNVTGDAPYTYQWRKNGQNLAGAKQSVFRLANNVTPEDAGAYSVVVSNAFGSATSGNTTMSVVRLPLVTPSVSGALLKGDTVALSVQLPGGVTCNNFGWRFSDDAIPGEFGTNLVRANLQYTDDGNYRFRCYYSEFTRFVTSMPFRIRVYARFTAPAIVVQPNAVAGRLGGTAVFTVGASGTPPFSYQWLKNEETIPGATNFVLSLTNLQAVANFSVMVSNQAGTTNSSVATLSLTNPPATNPTADALVSSGRASLTIHTNASLVSAFATLSTALSMDPQNENANFFLATVRLANLINQPATTNFMNRLLITQAGRDLYSWSAQAARLTNGHLVAPTGVNAAELTGFAKTNLLPEIRAARSNLALVMNPDFVVQITPTEAGAPASSGGEPVPVDHGDVCLARAMLNLAEYGILTANSWNLSIMLSAIDSLYTNNVLTAERILRDYPELLTFSDTSQVGPARARLEAAIDAYVQGMGIIRSRAPGSIRLFNLDTLESAEEERFRQGILDLKGSLDAAMVVNEQPQITARFGKLTDGTQSPRSLLPVFNGNLPEAETLPDKTLRGAVSVIGKPVIVIPPHDVTVPPGGTARLSVTAVGSEPMTYQWQRNGVTIAGATDPLLVVPNANLAERGQYRVIVSNSEGSTASGPVNLNSGGGGLVLVWGSNDYGQTNMPPGLDDVIAISAGFYHCLVLKANGTVIGWGDSSYGRTTPPDNLTNVVAISAGGSHSLALKANGIVVGWGLNGSGQTSIPADLNNVIAIDAGFFHSLALKTDGTVVGWGDNTYGQITIPQNLDRVVAISAGPQFRPLQESSGGYSLGHFHPLRDKSCFLEQKDGIAPSILVGWRAAVLDFRTPVRSTAGRHA